MQAAWYERNGAARDVLTVGAVDRPVPAAGEVLVRIHASGVNPSDVKSRANRPVSAPRIIPHSDGAGVVAAAGDGVDPARVGERVWLWNAQWRRPFGTAAQYCALPATQAVRLPDNTGFAEGACLFIPALTAMHAVRLADARPGRTLLITGGASAVGHYATQIATLRGARVIATASQARRDHALSAGADAVIDYKRDDVAARVLALTDGCGVDAIIDMDLSSTAQLLPKGVLAPNGGLVAYGATNPDAVTINFRTFLLRNITLQAFLLYDLVAEDRAAAIADLLELVEAGRLRHSIGARFPLAEIVAAHEAVEAGHVIGNVVVEIG